MLGGYIIIDCRLLMSGAGYTLKRKFKGHQNRTTQIRASMGAPSDFLICGSDDGWVYVWDLAGSEKGRDAASKQVNLIHHAMHTFMCLVTWSVQQLCTSHLVATVGGVLILQMTQSQGGRMLLGGQGTSFMRLNLLAVVAFTCP